jgi:tetratricopeptide (TPR) repeat protein
LAQERTTRISDRPSFYEEAIRRFQQTFRDPQFKVESGLAMAIAFDAIDKRELAIKRLNDTLDNLALLPGSEKWKELKYQKGRILANMGKDDEAKASFYEVYEIDVGYKDVGRRIAEFEYS